jgi:predicted CoA-binding protein
MPTTLADVSDFLAQKRVAVVGVSRDPKDFSRMLFREMSEQGYDMVPVNPAVGELEGRQCFGRIQQIDPPAQAVLIMTAARDTESVVRDCVEAGVRRIWMYRGGGQGSVTAEAVDLCRRNGVRLVEGHCPFMFLPRAGFLHRVHRLVMKIVGTYPAGKQ